MPPHPRRILSLRPFRPPNRFFAQLPRNRPQLPFLSQSEPRRQARFLTTERKRWIIDETWRAGKYTAVVYTTIGLFLIIAYGAQQEWMERKFPSPPEWSLLSRIKYRSAKFEEEPELEGDGVADWAFSSQNYSWLLLRLENPEIDGAGLQEQEEGGIMVAGVGKTGYDITSKSEPWRRGYYQVLMGAARASQHLDGWVRDKTRNIAFPANVVIGPSNPHPRPVPPGAKSAPREEDCEPAFDPPETFYMRILTTRGFTEKQRLDAALAFAAWLDFKGTPDAATEMYKWALDIATESIPDPKTMFDSGTGTIKSNSGPISANILQVTTSIAIHHARNNNLSTALPIFLSVLRARRSLPASLPTAAPPEEGAGSIFSPILSTIRSLLIPPPYPPPPPDGTTPPTRDAKEKCEEAALMAYIGEILYATNTGASGREEGLAWTRDCVDVAEEELRGRMAGKEATKICRECLETGLGNWASMVAKLAREEKDRKANSPQPKVGGWLGFGGELQQEIAGRWESEEYVVQERTRRAKDVLQPPVQRGQSSVMFA